MQDWEGSYEPRGRGVNFLWLTTQASPLQAKLTQEKWEISEEGWERWKPGSLPPQQHIKSNEINHKRLHGATEEIQLFILLLH